MHYFEGQARVFTSMEEASWAVSNDKIQKGMCWSSYEGPRWSWDAGDAIRHAPYRRPWMDEDCALVTDGRFSPPGALSAITCSRRFAAARRPQIAAVGRGVTESSSIFPTAP